MWFRLCKLWKLRETGCYNKHEASCAVTLKRSMSCKSFSLILMAQGAWGAGEHDSFYLARWEMHHALKENAPRKPFFIDCTSWSLAGHSYTAPHSCLWQADTMTVLEVCSVACKAPSPPIRHCLGCHLVHCSLSSSLKASFPSQIKAFPKWRGKELHLLGALFPVTSTRLLPLRIWNWLLPAVMSCTYPFSPLLHKYEKQGHSGWCPM